MDSDDDYGYDDDDQMDYSMDEDEQQEEPSDDYGYEFGGDEIVDTLPKRTYRIIQKSDLPERRHQAVEDVTSILGITDDEAVRVLRKYKWDPNRVHEEWFSDVDAVRGSLGMIDEPASPQRGSDEAKVQCMICFDSFKRGEMLSAACRHYFCQDCWSGYIRNAVASGPSCLDLRCPAADCKAKACVPASVIQRIATPQEWQKYQAFALRSFVEDNPRMSWCTGADCEAAAECLIDCGHDEALDVACTCGTAYCFNCHEEAHRPVACATVRKWLTKNSAESENLNWILANTKPCPKCHRPIEKNQGCMHMTCSQCRFEFCWLCNGDWKEHGERTGGFYSCNRYEVAKRKGEYDEDSQRRNAAKHSLERYMHYFERFDAHNKARQKAKEDAEAARRSTVEKLSDITKTPTSQLKYIMDAWSQIVECRRILKWTYAYGYYQFEDEANTEIQRQREFFEFLQGDAEGNLERLHEVCEKQIVALVDQATGKPKGKARGKAAQTPTPAEAAEAADKAAADRAAVQEQYQELRKKLIGLTDVTRDFFAKLVSQLEQGFQDMDKTYAAEQPSTSAQAQQQQQQQQQQQAKPASKGSKRTRGADKGGAAGGDVAALLQQQGFWACPSCTYHNTDLSAQACEVCQEPRE